MVNSLSLGLYSGIVASNLTSLSKLFIRLSKLVWADDTSTIALPASAAACFSSSVFLGVVLRPCSLRIKAVTWLTVCCGAPEDFAALPMRVISLLNGLNAWLRAATTLERTPSASLTEAIQSFARESVFWKDGSWIAGLEGLKDPSNEVHWMNNC